MNMIEFDPIGFHWSGFFHSKMHIIPQGRISVKRDDIRSISEYTIDNRRFTKIMGEDVHIYVTENYDSVMERMNRK